MAKGTGKLKPRKQALLVEVGSDWIKMVLAEADGGSVRLAKVHIEPIDTDVSVSETIAAAMKAQKFPAIPVTACLPRHAVNVRLLELPSIDEDELSDMIDLQVGRQTPYSKDEILSDYKVIGTTRKGTYTKVMLTIVQRSTVRARYHDLEASGSDIGQMSVSSEGASAWFLARSGGVEDDGATAVLDVDSSHSDLIVIQHGKQAFTKSISVGATQLAAGSEEARTKLMREIKRAIETCQGEVQNIEIASLVVTGAGARVDGLAAALGEETGLSATAIDSLGDVTLGKGAISVDDPALASVSLTAIVGMAMAPDEIAIHLIPDSVRMCRNMLGLARSLSLVGIMIMALLLAASLYGLLAFSYRQARVAELRSLIEKQEPDVAQINRMVEVIRATHERMDSRFAPINILPDLHKRTPEGVFFSNLDLDVVRSTLSLAGTAPARAAIRTIIKNLEDSALLTGVEEGGKTTMDKDGRFKFQIVASLEEDAQ